MIKMTTEELGGTPISFSHTDICCGKIAHLQAHVWR